VLPKRLSPRSQKRGVAAQGRQLRPLPTLWAEGPSDQPGGRRGRPEGQPSNMTHRINKGRRRLLGVRQTDT
jgi:hypothetical protein